MISLLGLFTQRYMYGAQIIEQLTFTAWLARAFLLTHFPSKCRPQGDNLQVQRANCSERHKLALAGTHSSDQITQTVFPSSR